MNLNFDLNKLKEIKLTQEQQKAIVFAVVLVGGGVYGYTKYLIGPLSEKIGQISQQLEDERGKLQRAKSYNAQDYERRLARTLQGTQFLARRIPTGGDRRTTAQDLIKITLEGGVELEQYRPEEKEESFKDFTKNAVTVEIKAGYHEFGEFLSRLTSEDVLYTIEGVTLRGIQGARDVDSHTLSAELRLVTYMQKEGS